MAAQTAIAEMICGHTVEVKYSGTAGVMRDMEHCPVCGSSQLVNEYHREQWHSRCKDGCRYSRKHGYAKQYAEQAAAKHYVKTGHETLVLWYRDVPPDLPAPAATLETSPKLFDLNASPPF